jgi:hypothetical protein
LAGGPLNINVDGPQQTGVGVGMVPDPPPKFPDSDYDSRDFVEDDDDVTFYSELNIRNVVLESEFQHHLWRTLLPLNMRELGPNPLVVKFSPKNGLGATVDVIWRHEDPQNPQQKIDTTIGTLTSINGVPSQISISNPNVSLLQGEELLFRVTPLADQLDDGIYTLEMKVITDNPHPFEVVENYWRIFGNLIWRLDDPYTVPFSDNPNQGPANLALVGNSLEIVLNQFGDGSYIRDFTSTEPYSVGSVHIYRFKTTGEGALTVRTVGLAEKVNTNLRLYRVANHGGQNFLSPLEQPVVNSTPIQVLPSFDWFPANRSEIDAQSFLHNQVQFDVADNEWYYVVVKNQEASLGQYRIEIDAPYYPLADLARVPSALSGSDTATITGLNGDAEALRYVEVQIPDYHARTLAVNTAVGQGLWDLDVFDAAGQRLPGQTVDGSSFTGGTFTIEPGPQAVYVRMMERSGNSSNSATVAVGANLLLPTGTSAPPAALGAGAIHERLEVNPLGDGSITDTVSPPATTQFFAMQAASGPLTLVVQPTLRVGGELRFGVYVNGQLVTWDQTRRDTAGQFESESLWTQIVLADLPNQGFARHADCFDTVALASIVGCDPDEIRPAEFMPAEDVDYAFDRSAYHSIVVRVEAVDPNATVPFKIDVQSGADRPMRTRELTINPLDGATSLLTERGAVTTANSTSAPPINPPIVTGADWVRLAIPSGIAGNVSLEVSRPSFELPPTSVEYRVYSLEGSLLASGSGVIPIFNPQNPQLSVVFSLPADTVTGGSAYYIQVLREGNPSGQLVLRATATFAGKNGRSPPMVLQLPSAGTFPDVAFFNPAGDAEHTFNAEVGDPEIVFVPFWVSAPGPVTIRAELTGASGPSVALYRARLIDTDNELVPFNVDLVLLDYTNQSSAGVHTLTANLDPGLYAIRATRTNLNTSGSADLDIDLPTPRVEEVLLDPNFGRSDLAGLKIRDVADNALEQSIVTVNGSNLIESYRSTLFHVVAPPGSIAGLTAFAEATDVGTAQATSHPLAEDLNAVFRVWRAEGDEYKLHPSFLPVIDPTPHPTIPNELFFHRTDQGPTARVVPGQDLYLTLHRQGLAAPIEVAANVPVPFSGTPDLVVMPLGLLPNNGETKVTVQVVNVGYAPADPSTALYSLRDDSQPINLQWQTSTQQVPTLGPFGGSIRVLAWDPVTPKDQVEYVVDPEVDLNDDIVGDIKELDEENNEQMRTLSKVDPNPPQVLSFRLADSTFDGTGTGDTIWGRYIADISGTRANYRVEVTDPDGDDQLYQTLVIHPDGSGTFSGEFENPLGPEAVNEYGVDFWKLEPTSGEYPNQFVAYALDEWGLESSRHTRTALVFAKPSWPTLMEFDKPNRQYVMEFDKDVVNHERTTDELFNAQGIPFVGSKKSGLLLHVEGATTASLNPLEPIDMDVTTRARLLVMGETIFDETFAPSLPPTNQVSLQTNIDISSQSLDAKTFTVGLKIVDVSVLDLSSPEIPLFTYGIPGLAEISVNLIVGLFADFNAGLTIAFDTAQATPLGLARPTFLGMDITPYISVVGEAEVLGFLDIASLEVTVGLNIGIDVGLKAPLMPNNPVPLNQLGSNLGVEVNGGLFISAAAEVLGWEIWSDTWNFPLGSVGDNVITWDEVDPLNNPLPPQQSQSQPPPPQQTQLPQNSESPQLPGAPPPPVEINPTKTGTSLLGAFNVLPYPQLVIDGPGGDALFVQVADPGTGRGNLHFSRRTGGTWTALTHMPQNENVSNPSLAMTADATGSPGVVVYQATTVADLNAATFDQFLNSQEIRWRYHDGTNWGSEQVLESNGRFDGNPAVAFNSGGQGVLAWSHNKSSQPLQSPGSNEIMVSLWNPGTHSWLSPVQLTSDVGASDARPAVYMAEDGTATVVWLRNPDTATTNSAVGKEVWFSRYVGGAWTPAAPLPTLGLPDFSTGGRITQVAIGSSGSDNQGRERVDVLIAYSRSSGEFEAESKLVHRAAWDNRFATPTAVQVVAEKATFSELRTLPNPDGGLMAYWQQANGGQNDVFASQLSPPGPGGSIWSLPTQLTFGDIQELSPTIAFDVDEGDEPVLQLLYHQKQPLDRPAAPIPPTTSDGVPMKSDVNASRLRALPELGFSRPLTFPAVTMAPAGSETPGEATVVNRGLAGTEVLVKYSRTLGAQTTRLDTQTIFLGPGRSFDLAYPFIVEAGNQTFSVEVTAVDTRGHEMVGTKDNVTQAVVAGATELVLTAFAIDGVAPVAGKQVTLTAQVSNVSDLDIGAPFNVALWLGDPSAPLGSGTLLGTQVLSNLQRHSSQKVSFNWTVPADGGSFVLTAVADNNHVITEAIEFNNARRLNVQVLPDARAEIDQLQLLNYSGQDNISVAARIFNEGAVDLEDVKVRLLWSRNNEPFQIVEESMVPLIKVGAESVQVQFAAAGWAGNNTYRVSVVDPAVDADPTNNSALANIFVQGFADLVVAGLTPSMTPPHQGAPFALRVAIENAGIDDAEDIRVEVFANSPIFGRRSVGRAVIDHIGPLSSGSVNVEIDTTQLVGSVVLEVVLDRLEKILEISDHNNTDTVTLEFAAAEIDIGARGLSLNYLAGGPNPTGNTRERIIAGRGGVGIGNATWTGAGIKSSVAATDPDALSVAYANNASLPLGPFTTFLGQPVDDTTVLVRTTRTGDVNLDGVVNDDDVTIVGAFYAPGVPNPHWALGDLDYNGFVDDDDVTLLGALYDPAAEPIEPPPTLLVGKPPRSDSGIIAWKYKIATTESASHKLFAVSSSGSNIATQDDSSDERYLGTLQRATAGVAKVPIDDDQLIEFLDESFFVRENERSASLAAPTRSVGQQQQLADSLWALWGDSK